MSNKKQLEIGNCPLRQVSDGTWLRRIEARKLEIPVQRQEGQALVTLLFFMVITIIITSAAIIIIIVNTQSTTKSEQGLLALQIAESGMENALLRLLRDPNYSGEPALTVGNGTATITISGTNPKTIVSKATLGSFVRTVQVEVEDLNGILTINSWKESF